MSAQATIVIVGGGLAAVRALHKLRELGSSDRVILISEERYPPYDRPPLSKDLLLQGEPAHSPLHVASFYSDPHLDLRLGNCVKSLNSEEHSILLESEEKVRYDKLLIATGARPRVLPIFSALGERAVTLRALDDALALRARLSKRPGHRLAVIGAGVLGLEIAASAKTMGCEVTVLERLPGVMARVQCEPVSAFLLSLHQRNGVRFIFSDHVIAVESHADGSALLRTDGGREITVDTVVVAIGVQPNDEFARNAGLSVKDGICVDEECRTSEPDIYAAGDVAAQWHPKLQAYIRSEHWASAQEQGRIAATSMLASKPRMIREIPWLWTDQFESNIQMAGRLQPEEWIARGDNTAVTFTLFGIDSDGTLTGAVTVNRGRDMRPARTMIAAHAAPSREALASSATDLGRLSKQFA